MQKVVKIVATLLTLGVICIEQETYTAASASSSAAASKPVFRPRKRKIVGSNQTERDVLRAAAHSVQGRTRVKPKAQRKLTFVQENPSATGLSPSGNQSPKQNVSFALSSRETIPSFSLSANEASKAMAMQDESSVAVSVEESSPERSKRARAEQVDLSNGFNPLTKTMLSHQENRMTKIKQLLTNGADIFESCPYDNPAIGAIIKEGRTAIDIAVITKDLAAIQLFADYIAKEKPKDAMKLVDALYRSVKTHHSSHSFGGSTINAEGKSLLIPLRRIEERLKASAAQIDHDLDTLLRTIKDLSLD